MTLDNGNIEYWQKTEAAAIRRLRTALNKPVPKTEDDTSDDFFDPWDDLIDGCVGSYSLALDRLAIDVLKAVRDRTTYDLLVSERGLAAELFMHMLADWLCDYGTSPRGVFPDPGILGMWDELIEKWDAYAAATWGEDW